MMKTKFIETKVNQTPSSDTMLYPLDYTVFVYLISENKVVEMPILTAFVLALRMELRQLKFSITDQQGDELIKSDGSLVIVANSINVVFNELRTTYLMSIDEGVRLIIQQQVNAYQQQLEEQARQEPSQAKEEQINQGEPAKTETTVEPVTSDIHAKLVSWDSVTTDQHDPASEAEAEQVTSVAPQIPASPAAKEPGTVKFI